ncbi:TetR/AcrR family transcriptional regulator [Actinomycetospora chibensis]|uniref:TetR/AcrR family transcriptional regulator n=1 Tax=Actinomycetospora chibensis TaxID=663606 RepID=A0ABV9RWJ7_9PSEU|nr:TetR family transcriptional regulator C-terminal domain-containing protein [Actinomycetospora chibensis]MDD7927252.1 TetR family transcriptional regulator C-terminal domain-containing protein [Actinomycetospora chibensis]
MPRLVDHAARRQEIAEALWRVVRRDGVHEVSVRTVADEAGTSPGALRHYFASQDELLGFALRAVVDRAAARFARLSQSLAGPRLGVRILEELLPLDTERTEEVQVYLALVARSATDPALRLVRDQAEVLVAATVADAVRLVLGDGAVMPSAGLATYHLVDGLALHGATWPERYPPEHLREVLRAHLATLVHSSEQGD